jgi:hypothetical protein
VSKNRVVRRKEVGEAFAPIAPLLREVITAARTASSFDATAKANPEIGRASHLHRLAGTKRWILVADGIVSAASRLPDGFTVETTEAQHNSGQYVFRFPGGVFTVRRQPHEGSDEGVYIQECLESLLEEAPLRDGINGDADLVVYLNVPAQGTAQLLVTHTTLKEPIVLRLDDIVADLETVAPHPAMQTPSSRRVRSVNQTGKRLQQEGGIDQPS